MDTPKLNSSALLKRIAVTLLAGLLLPLASRAQTTNSLSVNASPRHDFIVAGGGGQVNAITEMNGVLYLGGAFTEVGTNVGRAVPVDSAGNPLAGYPHAGFPKFDRAPQAIIPDNAGGWYLGGDFLNVGGTPKFRLVHLLSDFRVNPAFSADVDAQVTALFLSGTNLYVGGTFVRVTNVVAGVNVATNNRFRFAVLDPATGTPRNYVGYPDLDGGVNAFAQYGNRLYLGGAFTAITNTIGVTTNLTRRVRAAALDINTLQPIASFQANVDNTVRCFAISSDGATIYMGGLFTLLTNGAASFNRLRCAAVDVNGLPTTFNANFTNGQVNALILMEGINRLMAGGTFTGVNNDNGLGGGPVNVARFRLAAMATTVESGDPGEIDNNWTPSVNNSVNWMQMDGGLVYMGGAFTAVTNSQSPGGAPFITRRRMAACTPVPDPQVGGAASFSAFDPAPGNTVNWFAKDTNTGIIYMGGAFHNIKSIDRNRLAAVSVATGELLPWNPNANNTVFALATLQNGPTNIIYAGGSFTSIGTNAGATNRFRIVALNTNGNTITNFTNAMQGIVRALAVGQTNLFVGGDFTGVTNRGVFFARTGLVALSLTSATIYTNFTANFQNHTLAGGVTNVNAMALLGNRLYVGGGFSNVAGFHRRGLAQLNPNSAAVDATFNPHLGGTATNVNAITVLGTNLFIGGGFTTITNMSAGGTPVATNTRNRIAMLDSANGLVLPWNPNANNAVNGLSIGTDGATTNLFVAGALTTVNGFTRNRFAELSYPFDLAGNTNVTTSLFVDLDNNTFSTHARGDRAYVGGIFTLAGQGDFTRVQPVASLAVVDYTNPLPVVSVTGTPLIFTEDTVVPVDPALGLSDPNHLTFTNATISIVSGYVSGQDVLTPPSATGSSYASVWDAGTGTLTVNGYIGLYDLQQLLRRVTFSSGNSPGNGDRVVQFIVADRDGGVSAPVNRTINVLPVNDTPTVNPVLDVRVVKNSGQKTIGLSGITAGTGEAGTITVTAASSNPGLIPAPAINYTSPNTNGTLSFTPAANGTGVATITVTAQDNGGTANGAVDRIERTFTITVNDVNTAPAFDNIDSVTVDQDEQVTLALMGIDPGGNSDLIFTATSSNSGIIPNPTVTYNPGGFAASTSGTLSFRSVPGVNGGPVLITVQLQNAGGTANGGVDTVTKTFNVTVRPNIAPTLDAVASITTNASPGLVTAVLTGLSAGGSSNVQQSFTFTAVSDASEIIPNPTVAHTAGQNTATLSFTPVAGAVGVATITLTATDDGGTANGGANSVTRTFTVQTTVNLQPTLDNTLTDVTLYQNPGPLTANLTGISAGLDENQQITVTATSSNTGLVQPSVAPSPWVQGLTAGVLTYTPRQGASGSAVITVTVRDNGGTVGGGLDSISRSFVLNIIGGLNDTPMVSFPQANGTINAMVETNGVLYWGGTFTELGPITNTTGRAVWVDSNTGARLPGGPFLDRNVNIIIPDNSRGWYVGGEYQGADGRAFVRLMRVLPDRTIDPAFSANFNGAVTNLLLSGTNLYAVGGFTVLTNLTSAGVPVLTNSRVRFAVLDPASGLPRTIGGANGEPSFDLLTEQVIIRGNVAWVVGDFNNITNSAFTPGVVGVAAGVNYTNTATNSRVKLAAIDLTTGRPMSLGGAGGEPSFAGQIRAMVLDTVNDRLYVGGDFTAVTNVVWNPGVAGTGVPVQTNSRFRLAAINTDDGSVIKLGGDLNGEPGVDNTVWDLKLTGAGNTNLIVGGAFVRVTNNLFTVNVIASGAPGNNYTPVYTNSRLRMMALDVTPNIGLPNQTWTPSFDNVVRATLLESNYLYVVGAMTVATNNLNETNTFVRRRAVKISASPDVPNVTDGTWDPALGDTAFTLASDGQGVFAIGGQFNYIKPVLRNRLAAIETATGTILPWNPNANNNVYALTIADAGGSNAVYAGGVFTAIDGITRNRLAALSTDVGQPFGSNVLVTSFSNSVNGTGVRALATGPAGLYVGGDYTTITYVSGGITNTNTRLSLAAVNQTNGAVNLDFIADCRTNAALATSVTNVLALAYDSLSGNLFVGGVFGSISNVSQSNWVRFGLAALDSASGNVNTTFTNNLGGGAVSALLLSGPNLYAAGNFTTSTNGQGVANRSRMMSMSTATGESNNWHSTAGQIYSMGLIGTNLYIGGLFTAVTNGGVATSVTRNRVAERSTTQNNGAVTGWDPNLDNSVFTVLTTPTRLYIGGTFRTIGSGLNSRPVASFAAFENNGLPVITPLPGPASYVATSPASPLDSGLTVTDNNNIFLAGATVSITGGYISTQDVLSFTPRPGISGSFSAATGVLTLTGRATIGDYQAALRSVSYENTAGLGQNPADRTILYTVDDDFGVQGTATKTLKLQLNNATPTLDAIPNLTINEDQSTQHFLSGISAGGTDSQFLTVIATSSNPALIAPVVSYSSPDVAGILDLTPQTDNFGTATITVVVRDNGGTARGTDAVTNTFTVTVNSVNDQPTLTAIPNRIIAVEAPTTISLLAASPGGGTNEASQVLTITATSSDVAVIPDPTVNYTNPATAGTLTFTPMPQTLGSALITVTVQDDGGGDNGGVSTLVQTFTVTVLENAQPTLDPIPDFTFLEDPGNQIITLTNISPGTNSLGEREVYQTLTATVTSSSPSLVLPVLTYINGQDTGTLNITPRPSASGVATITVTFRDDGGTAPAVLAEGGATSLPDSITRSFTVTVQGGISDLPLKGFPMFNGQINALAETNGIMYLGGNFTEAGQATNVTGRAVWLSATNGARLPGGPVFDRNVNAIVSDGAGGWFVGGEFFDADNRAFTRLAKIRPDRTIDPAFSANFDAAVTNLFVSETNLFVVGGFVRVTNVNEAGISVLTNSRFRFAVLDTATGLPRRIGGTNGEPCFNLLTESVVVGNGVAYVGGDFTFVTNMFVAPGRVASGAAGTLYTNRAISNRTRFAAIDLTTGLLKALGGTNGEPSFSDEVRSMLLDGNRLYVGGNFTSVTNIWWTNNNLGLRSVTNSRFRIAAVDVTTGGLVPLGGANGEPSVDSTVWDFKLSGPGNTNLFISGAFVRVTNSVWTPGVVGSGAPGGSYTNMATNARVRIAALDPATALVNPNWSPSFDNVVRAAVVEGNSLFLVGSFGTVTNVLDNTNTAGIFTRRRAVKLSADTSLPGAVDTGWSADLGDTGITVAADGAGRLAVGGSFNYISPIMRSRLAAMDLATRTILPWDPNANNNVYALAIGSSGGSNVLYAGGLFTALNNTNTPKFRLAALNTNAFELNTNELVVAGFRNGANNGVRALATGPAGLYVGGEFTAITNGDGGTILRRGFAAVNPSNGTVNPAFVANAFTTAATNVLAINYDGANLYIGGAFTSVSNTVQGNVRRFRLAALDPVSGSVNTNFAGINVVSNGVDVGFVSATDLNDVVNVLLRADTNLYVGGNFTALTNSSITYSNDPGTGQPVPVATNVSVNTLVHRAIAVDPITGVTNAWAPRPGSQVFALGYSGTNVYVGGSFTAVTNGGTTATITRNRLAESSATQPGGNFTAWDPGLDNSALAFVQTPGRLYVAGAFTASSAAGTLINARPLGRFAAFENNSLPTLLTSPGPAAYTATDGPRAIDPFIRVADANNAYLVGASVEITLSYRSAEDVLSFTPVGGITGFYDSVAGVLYLTNRATVADYQAALRSVTYLNTMSTPDQSPRLVTFRVDDDFGIPVSATKELRIFLNNAAPTMDPVASVTINEDQPSSVTVTGISAGAGAEQTIFLTATSSDPAIIAPVVTYNTPSDTGTINITPVTNAFGTVTITVVAQDNAGTANSGVDAVTNTFTVTVLSLNDPPTVNVPASFTRSVNYGPLSITLTGITPGGGPDEASQTVTGVNATSGNTGLLPAPSVTYTAGQPTAQLNFTPAPNTTGSSLVTVTVVDDGGTANGGANTTVKTFVVTVANNTPPTLNDIGDILVNTSPGTLGIELGGITSGDEVENLTFTLTSSDTVLIPNPVVSHVPGETTALLSVTPALTAIGSANITVTVQDDGGTFGGGMNAVTKTFNVTLVTNAAPLVSVIAPTDYTILEDGPLTVSLENIARGINTENGFDEVGQILTVTATCEPAYLIAPVITYTHPNNTASVNLQPRPNASGVGTVTITVSDNGGTAGGGVDRVVQTVRVTVIGGGITDNPRKDFPVANGTVFTLAETNGVLYVGGSFTEMGTNSGRAAIVDSTTGNPLPFPYVDRSTVVVIPDGNGGWYLGGAHIVAGGQNKPRLAHVLADGTVDPNFNAHFNNTLRALLLDAANNVLYVGGDFTSVTNVVNEIPVSTNTRMRFAALNPVTGVPLTLSAVNGEPSFDAAIQSFALTGTTLYVGGDFVRVTNSVWVPGVVAAGVPGGTNYANTATNSRVRLAALDLTTALPTAFSADVDAVVRSVLLNGSGGLYVGGDFVAVTNAGIATNLARRVALLDAASGAFNTNFTAYLDARIRQMALTGAGNTNLFIAGDFIRITNVVGGVANATNSRLRLAALDAATGVPNPVWKPSLDAVAAGLVLDGAVMYVGGTFGNVTNNLLDTNATVTVRRRAAKISTDVNAVAVVDPSFDPAASAQVTSVAVQGGQVFLAGDFNFIRGVVRNRLAAISTTTGAILPWNPNMNNTVFALLVGNNGESNVVYAGGSFTSASGLTRNRLAAFTVDATEGTTNVLIRGFSNSFNSTVRALVLGDAGLYAGGEFTNVTDAAAVNNRRLGVAAVDPASGAVNGNFIMDAASDGSGTNVLALAYNGTNLYVGGTFTNIGGFLHYGLAAVNPINGQPNFAFTNDFNGPVLALRAAGSNLLVGGNFTSSTNTLDSTNGATRTRFAAVDVDNGSNYPFSPGAQARVFAMERIGTNLILGGVFTSVTNSGTTTASTRNRLAEFSRSTGAATPWNPNSDNEVYTMLARGNRLYVGGAFAVFSSTAQGMLHQGLAVFESNSLPVIQLTPGAMTYSTFDPAKPVDAGLILRDLNTEYITNATVRITGGYFADQDVLALGTNNYGINAAFDTVTGTLSLAGFSSVENYQAALRSVTYLNTSFEMDFSPRTVTFTVGDNLNLPVSASRGIQMIFSPLPPTINQVNNVHINEDEPFTVTLSGISAGGSEDQVITITVDSTAPEVVSPVITYTSPNTTGSLNVTSRTNASGTATITLTLQDSGGTANGGQDTVTTSFEVIINSVNDAPTLNPLNSVVINANIGVQNVPLTGLSVGGGADEAAQQTLTVQAFSTDTLLIPNPAISYNNPDSTGTLTYTPGLDATGVATISVVVTDTGNLDFGGINSITNTFSVTILPNAPPTVDFISDILTNTAVTNITVGLSNITAGAGGGNQVITAIAASSNPGLIPPPVVNFTNGNSTGQLVLSPVASAVGTAVISLILQDTGGTSAGGVDAVTNTFLVTVTTNARPTLSTTFLNLTLNEDPGTIALPLANISRGTNVQNGFGEGSQIITVAATSSNPNLVIPTVTYTSGNVTGTLNVTPRANASGTATITVTVSDNGGTTDGGVDALVRTFTMTVMPNGLSDYARNEFLVNNGQINAIIETNGVLYLGGTFTEFGTNIGKGFVVDGVTGVSTGRGPVFPVDVNAAVSDGQGGWYVGGNFPNLDNRPFTRLVHLLPNRTIDPNFSANLDAAANALLLDGTNLYVGGAFVRVTNVVNGVPVATNSRLRFAVLNAANGAPIDLPSNPAFEGALNSLAKYGSTLYVGGAFTNITNIVVGVSTNQNFRFRVAAIDLATGQPTPFHADMDVATCRALAVSTNGATLYMGGDFRFITNNGITYSNGVGNLAAVSAATGEPVAGFQADLSARARAIVVVGEDIIVGGDFVRVTNGGPVDVARLIAMNGASGAVNYSWFPTLDGVVTSLNLNGANLYVGGGFTLVTNSFGGSGNTRRRAMALSANLSAAAALRSFNPDLGNQANAIMSDGTNVFVGGVFNYAKPLLRNRLAAMNPATGQLLAWNPNANNTVFALAVTDVGGSNVVFAGGQFTTMAGLNRGRLALLSTNVAEAVSTNLLEAVHTNGVNGIVRALAVGPAGLYVGGDFTVATNGGAPVAALGLVAFNQASGLVNTAFEATNVMANPLAGGPTNVNALLFNGTNLYVAGAFTNIAGANRYGLASLNPSSGTLNSGFLANFGGSSTNTFGSNVLALASSGSALYVGGTFTCVTNVTGPTNRSRLVALNPETGTLLPGFIANANNTVQAFALYGTNVYAGGVATSWTNTIGGTGVGRNRLAELQSTIGTVGGFNPNFDNLVTAIHVSGSRLYVGGSFTGIGAGETAMPIQGLAVFGTNEPPLISTTAAPLEYYLGSGAQPVDNGLTLVDRNNPSVPGATVSITAGFAAGEDVLALPSQFGLTASYSAASGVLTISGVASVSTYEAALRGVTYQNTAASNPSTSARTVTFTVTDGNFPTSVSASRQIVPQVGGNNAPTINAIGSVTVAEDAGEQTISLSGLTPGAGESSQAITGITATSGNTALIPSVTVNYANPATTGTLRFTATANASGTATITVIVRDDGGTQGTGVDSTTNTFTVTVTSVNDAPTLDAISSVTVLEDASQQTVGLSGISPGPADESGQTVGFVSAVSSDSAIVPNPTGTYGGGGTMNLNFTPVPNASGTATITVTFSDNGGTAGGGADTVTRTFAITVTPVNDAPTFNTPASLTNFVNSGALNVNLTGISPGPLSESGQTVSLVTASSSNTGLIPNPTVTYTGGSTGSLSFTPVANATGTATVTVTVQDNGGTAGGGVDSVSSTFRVVILPNSVRTVRVSRDGANNAVVSWSVDAAGFVLQSTTNLASTGASAWVNVTNTPVVVGTNNVVTNTQFTTNRVFYRLNKP